MNKALDFQNRLISDAFMEDLPLGGIRTEILASILETYEYRTRLGFSQNKWSELKSVPVATLKRIELGTCYNLKLIAKYVIK